MQKLAKTKYPKLVSSKNINELLSYKFYAYFCTRNSKKIVLPTPWFYVLSFNSYSLFTVINNSFNVINYINVM